MQIKWGRAIAAVLAAEVLGVLILAVLVAAFGPGGYERSLGFANRLGAWVGPISGFVLVLAGGWWTAKAARPGAQLANGVAVGVLAAVLDLALSAALGAGLVWLLLVSNLGRVIGGALGGWLAGRRVNSPTGSLPSGFSSEA